MPTLEEIYDVPTFDRAASEDRLRAVRDGLPNNGRASAEDTAWLIAECRRLQRIAHALRRRDRYRDEEVLAMKHIVRDHHPLGVDVWSPENDPLLAVREATLAEADPEDETLPPEL